MFENIHRDYLLKKNGDVEDCSIRSFRNLFFFQKDSKHVIIFLLQLTDFLHTNVNTVNESIILKNCCELLKC